MVYLFLGEDSLSKDAQLKKLKYQFLKSQTEQFNLDILYGRELTLMSLQERLSCLPVNSPARIVVVKEAEELTDDLKEFIAGYCLKPFRQVVLVLDVGRQERKDNFTSRISKLARTVQFKAVSHPDAFTLSRSFAQDKPDYSLRILHQLLKQGVRPEQIVGGLRYAWEKEVGSPAQMRRKLKKLVECDRDIKTGRLKPAFALEKLVISLCGLKAAF